MKVLLMLLLSVNCLASPAPCGVGDHSQVDNLKKLRDAIKRDLKDTRKIDVRKLASDTPECYYNSSVDSLSQLPKGWYCEVKSVLH